MPLSLQRFPDIESPVSINITATTDSRDRQCLSGLEEADSRNKPFLTKRTSNFAKMATEQVLSFSITPANVKSPKAQ